MTQECTLVYETEPPIPFTCADGTTIEKGAILKITDPMTCALADGDGDTVAGIAAETKLANSGVTKIAVYRRGIFKGYAGALGVTAGKGIMTYNGTGDDNDIVTIAAGEDDCMGTSFEAADNNHTFLFELNPNTRDIA